MPPRRLSLDTVFARACLAVVVAYGLGAITLSPRRYGVAVALLGSAAVARARRRGPAHGAFSVPLALFLVWWTASVMWATTTWSWTIVTWRTVPAVVALMAVGALVPAERVAPGLVTGCYVAIAWTALTLVFDPSGATTIPTRRPDGAAASRTGTAWGCSSPSRCRRSPCSSDTACGGRSGSLRGSCS